MRCRCRCRTAQCPAQRTAVGAVVVVVVGSPAFSSANCCRCCHCCRCSPSRTMVSAVGVQLDVDCFSAASAVTVLTGTPVGSCFINYCCCWMASPSGWPSSSESSSNLINRHIARDLLGVAVLLVLLCCALCSVVRSLLGWFVVGSLVGLFGGWPPPPPAPPDSSL